MSDDMLKKGFVKRNGYWVSEKMDRFEPAKPLCCPKCNIVLQHKDDKYILKHNMCGECWFEEEIEELRRA